MWEYNYDYLSHHGILGQKWGIRRFQNPDGSLTAAGKKRYGANSIKEISSTKGLIRRMKDTQKYGLSNLDELANMGADMASRTRVAEQNLALDNLNAKIHTWEDNTTPESIIKDIGKITKNTELRNGLYKIAKEYRTEKKDIASEFDSLVNFKDENEKTFYEASSEIVESLQMHGVKKERMIDVAWHMYLGVYEDGQQGSSNAYSLKAHDDGVIDKVQNLDKRVDSAYRKANEDATQLLTKECPNINENTAKRLAGKMNESENWNKTEASIYHLHDASRGDQLNKLTEEINFAKNVCTKLKDCQSNWDILDSVIEDLGYDNKMPDELTASDWRRINQAANGYY